MYMYLMDTLLEELSIDEEEEEEEVDSDSQSLSFPPPSSLSSDSSPIWINDHMKETVHGFYMGGPRNSFQLRNTDYFKHFSVCRSPGRKGRFNGVTDRTKMIRQFLTVTSRLDLSLCQVWKRYFFCKH